MQSKIILKLISLEFKIDLLQKKQEKIRIRIKKSHKFQKATQSSESDTDFIQDITINSVFEASICGENETPTKAKIDLNKNYT